MNKIKKIIIVLSIVVLLVFLAFIGVKKWNSYKEKKYISNEEEGENIIESKDVSHYEYKVLNDCINEYMQKSNINNTQYYSIDSKGNKERIISEEEFKENIYYLLSDSFIKRNNINMKNLNNYVEFYEEQLVCVPLRIKVLDNKIIKSFVVEALIENLDFKYKGIRNYIVNVDFNNYTFSVEPTNKKFSEINDVSSIEKIEKNEKNEYRVVKINIENITKEYMNLYKRILLAKPELAYEYLNKEYRDLRFGKFENFNNYIKNNYEELKRISVEEYLVNNVDDGIEYFVKDKFGRIIVFEEKKVLEYTVCLDEYTIKTDKFKKTYNESKEDIKVKLNIEKWIKMLNNRDYINAYNVMNKTFRENKFKTEKNFEDVMRKVLPLHYKVLSGDFSYENGTYVQKIMLEDIEGKKDKEIKLSIIMELKDNYEFEMSFNLE